MDEISLATLAGIIAADGHLDKRLHAIRIVTADVDFLQTIEKLLLELSVKYKVINCKSGFGSDRMIIYIYDRELKSQLETKFSIPRGKKSEKLTLPRDLSKSELCAFINGLFSGDGSISFDYKNKRRYAQIIFWTKSRQLSLDLKLVLVGFDINSCWNYSANKDQYRLTIRRKESIKQFDKVIGFIHPNKQKILNMSFVSQNNYAVRQ